MAGVTAIAAAAVQTSQRLDDIIQMRADAPVFLISFTAASRLRKVTFLFTSLPLVDPRTLAALIHSFAIRTRHRRVVIFPRALMTLGIYLAAVYLDVLSLGMNVKPCEGSFITTEVRLIFRLRASFIICC